MKACQICLSSFEDSVRFCPYHGVELKVLPGKNYEVGESICGYYLQKAIGKDGLGSLFRATKGGNAYRLRLFSEAVLCETKRASWLHDVLESDTQISGGAIPVVDFDWLDSGELYSAHPYIPGRSFRDVLNVDIKLSESDVAAMLFQLLRAVRDIHGQQIVHGNISLSNIILDSGGHVRLHDIGLWNILRGEHFEELRNDNPEFFGDIVDLMSPEVARGEEAQIHSDVFSCGAAACCMLAGHILHERPEDRMAVHVSGKAYEYWMKHAQIRLSEDFADLLEASTIDSAGVRFQTVRAFMTALLSIHPELEESQDALPVELLDRLLNGAERVSSFHEMPASVLFDKELSDLRRQEEVIETTRKGVDPDRTVVEKTRYDDLSALVGESLANTAVTDMMERAVTTEIDPMDASPTVEFTEPIFADSRDISNSLEKELSNILGKSVETSSDEDAKFDLSSLMDASFSTSPKNKENVKKSESPSVAEALKIVQNSETTDNQTDLDKSDKSDEETNKSEKSDEEANDDFDKIDERTVNLEDFPQRSQIVSDAEEDKTQDDTGHESVTDRSDISEALAKAEAAEHAFEEDEARIKEKAEEDSNAKPHKRIGKKKSGSDDLERGDVVSMTSSMELKRVKRRRRRDPADCEPRNEVVTAEVEIKHVFDLSKMPAYSNVPGMTLTSGFVDNGQAEAEEDVPMNDDSAQAEDSSSIQAFGVSPKDAETPHSESSDYSHDDMETSDIDDDEGDADEWFGDEPPRSVSKGRKRIEIALAVAGLLVIVCVVVLVVKLSADSISDEPEIAANQEDGRIQEFESLLSNPTPENRQKATELFDGLRKGNLEQKVIQKCRNDYIAAFIAQAQKDRQAIKTSEEIPDPLDLTSINNQLDTAYYQCIAAIEPDAPDVETQTAACEQTRSNAQAQAKTKAEMDAKALLPELQKQLDAWAQLDGIYRDVVKQQRGQLGNYASALEENNNQKNAFSSRIDAIKLLETTELAANDQAPIQDVQPDQAAETVPDQAAETVPDQAAETVPDQPAQPEPDQNLLAAAQPVQNTQPEQNPVQNAKPSVEQNTKPNTNAQRDADNTEVAQNIVNPPAPKPNQDIKIFDPHVEQPKAQADNAQEIKIFNMLDDSGKTAAKAEAPKEAESKTSPKRINIDDDEPEQAAQNEKSKGTQDTDTPKPANTVPTGKLIADAQVAMGKQDFDGAVKLLEQATRQDPKNSRAWMSMARANERLGKLVLAADNAEKSCKISKTASCYIYLGDVYQRAGITDKAKTAYQTALDIDPNNATAKSRL